VMAGCETVNPRSSVTGIGGNCTDTSPVAGSLTEATGATASLAEAIGTATAEERT
jgi:hypothetical protein